MASTNVTNIKNAFTLSNTLGANVGNLTSFDPSLLKTPYDFIILKQIPITVSSSLTEVKTTSQGIITTTQGTINVISGTEPLYYNSGFYSTDSLSNDIKQKGTKIGLIIKQFLDKAFNSFLYTLSEKDITDLKVTEIKINFASQESAIPNSDSEQAGNPPPGGKPVTPPITSDPSNVGNLARARYAWCEWFITEYVKNIKNNSAITPASKKALSNISNEEIFKALQITIAPKILLGFTPFSNTKLADGAPQDSKYNVPLYFRDGTANQNLLNNSQVSQQMSQTGKSVQALQDELKSRYNSEQKSSIIFYAKIENYKTEKKCDAVQPSPGTQALPPDFIVEQPVGAEVNDKIYIQGMALQIPDRFGNLRHFSSTLPYHERIIYGIVLRLIDLTFPGSEAFKDIDYISSFDSTQIPFYPKDKQTSNKNLYDLFKDSFYITNYGGLTGVLITSLYQFRNPAYPFNTLYWNGGNVLSLIERGVMTGTGESDDQKFKSNRTLVDFYIKGFGVAKSQMTNDYPPNYFRFNNDLLTYAYTPSYYFYTTEDQPENLINNFTSNKFDISGEFKRFCNIIDNKIVKVEGYNDTPETLPENGIFNSFDGNKNIQHEFLYDSLPPTYKNQKIYPIYNCFNSSNYYVRRKCKF